MKGRKPIFRIHSTERYGQTHY